MKHYTPLEWRILKKFDVDHVEVLGLSSTYGGRLVLLEKDEKKMFMVIDRQTGDAEIHYHHEGYLKEVDYGRFELKLKEK